MGKRKDFPSFNGDGTQSREDRVALAKKRLEEGFYSGERGSEFLANSLASLIVDEYSGGY